MSEFKFACPVCGQHITADSSVSGTQLECPTCFQKLVVPQAPAFGDPKLILTAAKVSTTKTAFVAESPPPKGSRLEQFKHSVIPLLVLLSTGGLALLLWHNQLTRVANRLAERATSSSSQQPVPTAFHSPNPIPSNVTWSLNVTNAPIPNAEVAGRVHGHGFLCERALYKGDRLSLRQGGSGQPDLAISVSLSGRRPEELAGKAIVVSPATPTPAARVVLRWRNDQQEPVTEHLHAGYAMKLIFGAITDNRIRGRIYIALPDEQKSFAAGNFDAEIIRPSLPLAGK